MLKCPKSHFYINSGTSGEVMILNNVKAYLSHDIHPKFVINIADSDLAKEIVIKFPSHRLKDLAQERLMYFKTNQERASNYFYWFMLGTLWVEFTGHTSMGLWKELFSKERPDSDCLMKPHELLKLHNLPDEVTCFRAHRYKEKDWISYTLDEQIALRFLTVRPRGVIKKYTVKKSDIKALFLRRGEMEIIVLDKNNVREVLNG